MLDASLKILRQFRLTSRWGSLLVTLAQLNHLDEQTVSVRAKDLAGSSDEEINFTSKSHRSPSAYIAGCGEVKRTSEKLG